VESFRNDVSPLWKGRGFPHHRSHHRFGFTSEGQWAESFFTLIEIFIIFVYNKFLLIKDELSLDVGSAQKGGSDLGCESLAVGL